MKQFIFLMLFVSYHQNVFCWGFFGHQKINYYAVFLLPPEMLVLYKAHIEFLAEHSVDPDKRRYAIPEEAPRHYIDIDLYGKFPFDSLPREWNEAVAKYSEDSLQKHGIVPWWIQVMQRRLTEAFKAMDQVKILKYSAELGHYIADAHVPLHASSNHNGQLTNQRGIHGFWESRIPELLADRKWNFFMGKAVYIYNLGDFIWERVLESAAAADTVLQCESELTTRFSSDRKFAYEERNGKIVRQYSSEFSIAYDTMLKGMIERRMRQSIHSVASFWYTSWINAGQPDLSKLLNKKFSDLEYKEFAALNKAWKKGSIAQKTREHE